VVRLLRKAPVYSTTTTAVFVIGPWIYLLTALGSAAVTPLLGARPLVSFELDLVWFAYAWGLGRAAIMLAALDTGSAFEGMGAAREATFATMLEPAFFLATGALCLVSHTRTLHTALTPDRVAGGAGWVRVWLAGVVGLLIGLQVEAARVPVDDPTTHLELTMIHEVMVLDHSGPELAAIQAASAIKLYVGSALIATLLNPWAAGGGALAATVNLGLCLAIGVGLGTVESLIARLRLRRVPTYIVVALAAGVVALLATAWSTGPLA